jgi:hypothetical protein
VLFSLDLEPHYSKFNQKEVAHGKNMLQEASQQCRKPKKMRKLSDKGWEAQHQT